MSSFHQYNAEIDDWAEKYAKAQADGVFGEPPQQPVPSPQTADGSFFGATQTKPTALRDVDAEYWNQVHQRVSEQPVVMSELASRKEIGKVVDKIAAAPNPIPPWTVGPDYLPEKPGYDEEDLKQLTNLRLELHGLQDKLNAFDAKGEGAKRLETKIETLKEKITDLADAISNGFPFPRGKD